MKQTQKIDIRSGSTTRVGDIKQVIQIEGANDGVLAELKVAREQLLQAAASVGAPKSELDKIMGQIGALESKLKGGTEPEKGKLQKWAEALRDHSSWAWPILRDVVTKLIGIARS